MQDRNNLEKAADINFPAFIIIIISPYRRRSKVFSLSLLGFSFVFFGNVRFSSPVLSSPSQSHLVLLAYHPQLSSVSSLSHSIFRHLLHRLSVFFPLSSEFCHLFCLLVKVLLLVGSSLYFGSRTTNSWPKPKQNALKSSTYSKCLTNLTWNMFKLPFVVVCRLFHACMHAWRCRQKMLSINTSKCSLLFYRSKIGSLTKKHV